MRRTLWLHLHSLGRTTHARSPLHSGPAILSDCDTLVGFLTGYRSIGILAGMAPIILFADELATAINCAGHRSCVTAFHPMCAREAGLPMVVADESENYASDGENQPEPNAQLNGNAAGAQPQTAGGSGAKAHKGGEGAPAKRPKSRRRKEGTSTGECRLLCFCNRHRKVPVQGPHHAIFTSSVAPSAVAGRAKPGSAAQPAAGASMGSTAAAAAAAAAATQASGIYPFSLLGPNPDGCARCTPYDAELRRGMRAPDMIALALQKRLFVQKTPYVVTGCLGQPSIPQPASRKRPPPLGPASPGSAPVSPSKPANGSKGKFVHRAYELCSASSSPSVVSSLT